MTYPDYRVTWDIDVSAEPPEHAAREAMRIQRDPDSLATLSGVKDRTGKNGKRWTVDLAAEPGAEVTEEPQ